MGAAEPVLFGEGALTHVLLRGELMDMRRFKNARQLGNYFGLCPSESSTAERRHLGAITKHGNPRLRRMMVELAWRVVRWQPQYVALQRWGPVLRDQTRNIRLLDNPCHLAHETALSALNRYLVLARRR